MQIVGFLSFAPDNNQTFLAVLQKLTEKKSHGCREIYLVDSAPPEEGFHVSGWKSGLASLCTSLLFTCSTPASSLTEQDALKHLTLETFFQNPLWWLHGWRLRCHDQCSTIVKIQLHHCEQSGGFNQFLLKKQTVAAQTITWCKRRRLANYKTCSCLQAMYKECIPWVGTSSPLTCCRKSVMLRGLTSSAIHTSSSKYQQGIQRLTCPFCSYIKLSLVTVTFLIAISKHNQKSLLYCILTIGHSLLQHFCSKPIFFLLLFKHCIQNNKARNRNRTDGFR